MKVSYRGGFSDRNQIKPENTEIQLKTFDDRTRIQLENMISQLFSDVYEKDTYDGNDFIQEFCIYVLGTIFSEQVSTQKYYHASDIFNSINYIIENDDYDDILSLIEGITKYWDNYLKREKGYAYYNEYSGYVNTSVFEIVNTFFEREYVGYRFIDGLITPISDNTELTAIKEAISTPYQPVYTHLAKANQLLADRDNPDYENSIKESISAVEAICQIIMGATGGAATLGAMLKKLEDKGIFIHEAMKQAFIKIYGYTSDANGIRHAGDIGGVASTFEDAKYMLVSCSAFINYLTALQARINSDL